jgi:hypothetical protein
MEEPVSSIYGPGAIFCWPCTALSVVLAWTFNLSSRKYDAVTSDFLACLLLPAIAVIHLIYELSCTKKTEDWNATPIMDAIFTICMDFYPFGFMLCILAFPQRHTRRFVLSAVVTLACSAIVLVVFATNSSKLPHFDRQNAVLPVLLNCCAIISPPIVYFGIVFYEFFIGPISKTRLPQNLTGRALSIFKLWWPVSFLQCLGSSLYYSIGVGNCEGKKTPAIRRFIATGYFFRQHLNRSAILTKLLRRASGLSRFFCQYVTEYRIQNSRLVTSLSTGRFAALIISNVEIRMWRYSGGNKSWIPSIRGPM